MAESFDFVETDSAKIYTSIIGSLMNHCNEALYPGDERRIFGEGIVSLFVSLFSLFDDKAKQRTLQYARGNVLDAIGARYDVPRLAPKSASAMFKFSVSDLQIENIIIPAGTRITADGSVYFATQETTVLPAYSSSVDVLAVCTSGGADYNGYAPGTIKTIVDLIPYITSAVNTTTSSGGDDGEPYTESGDIRYRERIRLSPAGLSPGTESGYKYYALSADAEIVDIEIECPEETPNTVNIYALMVGGNPPDADTLEKILETIDANNVRIMTDHVQCFAPEAVNFGVEIKYYCDPDNEAAAIEAIEGSGGAIDQYIEWQTAKLGRGINPEKLRSLLYNSGATMVDIVQPTRQALDKTQYAKLSGTPVISHEVVSW